MISCPNCGKDIADDSVHCGHCGHKIEVESKKTMMGFGAAVDADALRAKLDKAKKREGEDGSQGSKLPRPSGGASAQQEEAPDMAPTQLMDSVEMPSPGGDDGPDEVSDLETAPTEMMDQPEASDFDEFEEEADDAFAATKAMSTVETQKVSASDAEEDSGSDERWQIGELDEEADPEFEDGEHLGDGPVADDSGVASASGDAGGVEIDLGEVEAGGVVVDSDGPSADAAHSESDEEDDSSGATAGGGGRDLMQMRKGGDASAAAGEGDEAGDAEAVAGMDDYLDEDGEDEEGPDKKLIIGGAVALLLLGCCGIGCVSSFMFGVF